MSRKASHALWAMLLLLIRGGAFMEANGNRVLFEFGGNDAEDAWQTVNDGVMGGISDGRFRISENGTMEFSGTLSLENNGGFASVRSRPGKLDLKEGDTFLLRVRGDGREYSFNLYTKSRRTAFSYRAIFATEKDIWIEVPIPIDRFAATSFGQVVKYPPVDPNEVNTLVFC